MNNEYLMHFNPFHDPKNGQFTSGGNGGTSKLGARKVQRKLNKISDEMYRTDAKFNQAAHKEIKNAVKSGKYDLDSKKYNKYEKRAMKYHSEMIKNSKKSNQYKDMIDNILNEAKDKGYKIDSKEVVRDAAKGKKIAGYFFGGMIGYKVAENMSGGNLVNMVSTQKYKVRK